MPKSSFQRIQFLRGVYGRWIFWEVLAKNCPPFFPDYLASDNVTKCETITAFTFVASSLSKLVIRPQTFNEVGWGLMICLWSFNFSIFFVPFSVCLSVEYSYCFISEMNLDLNICCFDSWMS